MYRRAEAADTLGRVPQPRRSSERGDRRRRQIIDAALAEIRAQPVADVQLSAIAARAGLGPSHALYYFGSRDGVLIAAVAHAEAAARRPAAASGCAAIGDPAERLAAFVDAYLPNDRHDPVWKLWFEGWLRSASRTEFGEVGSGGGRGLACATRRLPRARHRDRRRAPRARRRLRAPLPVPARRACGPRPRRPHHARRGRGLRDGGAALRAAGAVAGRRVMRMPAPPIDPPEQRAVDVIRHARSLRARRARAGSMPEQAEAAHPDPRVDARDGRERPVEQRGDRTSGEAQPAQRGDRLDRRARRCGWRLCCGAELCAPATALCPRAR